jgi:hypothetical protein
LKNHGRKRKEKYSRNSFSFLFARGSEFLYSWKRVKLQLDLAWYDNTMEKPRCDVNRSCGMISAAYYRVARLTIKLDRLIVLSKSSLLG